MRNSSGSQKSLLQSVLPIKTRNFCKVMVLLPGMFCTLLLQAQTGIHEKIQMADGLRSNGKIYVVVAVLLTVLTGLIIYVVTVDRKITKLEKEDRP